MAWTDEMVEDLKKMWKEGLTTGEIGRRLNVSKNSIVGKVHRLGLSGRPSPIKKKDGSKPTPSAPKTAKPSAEKNKNSAPKKATPAKEPSVAPVMTPAAPKIEVHKKESASSSFSAADIRHKPHHYGNLPLTELDNHTCRWPVGDPKDANFHFCGKKVRLGQTYCEEHAAIAYVKPGKK